MPLIGHIIRQPSLLHGIVFLVAIQISAQLKMLKILLFLFAGNVIKYQFHV
jgi:hypothetical protein